jgi:rhodanese domain protein
MPILSTVLIFDVRIVMPSESRLRFRRHFVRLEKGNPMDIVQLSPLALKIWMDEGRAFRLLDVRTDEEAAICSLPDAVHIPMNLIPLRQNELPDDGVPLVVYCHHGIRSLHTAMYLADAGFENLYNLQGGIDAWAAEIDGNMMRY